jgi:hypothetical protein
MAVMNDDLLRTLLGEAGESFALPDRGPAEIRRQARPLDDETIDPAQIRFDLDGGEAPATPPSGRTMRSTVSAHRWLAVAASVVVLAGLTTIGLGLGPTTPTGRRSVAAPAIRSAPSSSSRLSTPSTTAPFAHSGAAPYSPLQGAQAPASGGATSSGTSTGQPATTTPPLPTGSVGQPARIEQTGSLNLAVGRISLSTVLAKLAFLAEASNGFVSNSQSESGASGGAAGGSVTLQVPVADFSTVLRQVEALGRATQVTTKATDVSGQYVDLQSRITALEDSRQQYLTIMSKATSVGDVLAVQAQLDGLQQQIEQLQGQLQVLTAETAYSTLTATVSASGQGHQPPTPRPESGLGRAWHDSVHGFAAGAEGLIRVAGPAIFVLLCLAVVGLGGRVAWRRVQRHNL